jgi:hypothetical protein
MLAKGKIINDCNGSVTINTEGNIKDFINTTVTTHKIVNPEEFLKELKQNLNTFKSNCEPVIVDTLTERLLNDGRSHIKI